ncbi:hypothetical protein A2291_08060 [candidate division WOR-1 bacterium RIFOXYB2_FULL_42_35]|uniref:Uncharacterized protein n=1 Tax=candidate division WOR-1 bacterium RIFOXYC2_FULL_41_25 TaxID=1802586 RepID=A0A1F4TIF0_UNCSA|nr:MAG: hypothetical protein A2247_01980 [candidate division WOR-1 bacterium RIFOXYA2_FULL_41_14]OGC24041.1 MAG: hypothetical protein A2291_08060 [candidate division WOR-1 bacterium RIFOXYB2_FULL_42_35]OGC32464.1 MAG: hypothetical protein A2462_00160 [candidate division WOR-1 bacterium RIFOXYC2_FULL_41_25]OGC44003.1 MAG: hypothetical protein A2548_00190 [candidate division WOR-1 bacterium RIFOXYD2_FULL_41_8]
MAQFDAAAVGETLQSNMNDVIEEAGKISPSSKTVMKDVMVTTQTSSSTEAVNATIMKGAGKLVNQPVQLTKM